MIFLLLFLRDFFYKWHLITLSTFPRFRWFGLIFFEWFIKFSFLSLRARYAQRYSHYFLIRLAQTKITLFIFILNWVIRENESLLIVEPCSRVICCVEIKLQYFSRKYIFICTIYNLLMQLLSAILYDTFMVAATLGKNLRPLVPKWRNGQWLFWR